MNTALAALDEHVAAHGPVDATSTPGPDAPAATAAGGDYTLDDI